MDAMNDAALQLAKVFIDGDEAERRLRRALATMSDVNQWLGKHDGHVEAVKLGQAMRDVRWVLVGLEGEGQQDDGEATPA